MSRFSRNQGLLLVLALGLLLASGCATRREVVQFQSDHQEFRQRLIELEQQNQGLEGQLTSLEPKLDTLLALLGGNVEEYLRAQEKLLRALKADQRSVSTDLERLIVTLTERVEQNEGRTAQLLMELDTFTQLISTIFADSLGPAGMEAIEAQRLFQQSYADYIGGEHETARMGFSMYLQQYPATSMADDALYWMGETYLSQLYPDSARQVFQQLEDRYPDSNLMKTALLKRAISWMDVGAYDEARRLFERILKEYPDTNEADQAAMRLKELKALQREAAADSNKAVTP